MQQQISVVTLGIADLPRSRHFYGTGFGWRPVFENDDIAFYQMNGFVLGTWLQVELAADSRRPASAPGNVTLAHNVAAEDQVALLIDRLIAAGGSLLRAADAPPYGGLRGYVADPDGHLWEIAFNPAWSIDQNGRATFGL